MREVGQIVRWHRAGGPLDQMPLGAQIVAVANAYDTLVAVPDGPRADRRGAIDQLTAAAGIRYGQEVVNALAVVVGVKPRAGRRRRQNDVLTPRIRGAA